MDSSSSKTQMKELDCLARNSIDFIDVDLRANKILYTNTLNPIEHFLLLGFIRSMYQSKLMRLNLCGSFQALRFGVLAPV